VHEPRWRALWRVASHSIETLPLQTALFSSPALIRTVRDLRITNHSTYSTCIPHG